MSRHRYDSGVYHDTYPGEAIGCCALPGSHQIHDVPCERCGAIHGVPYDCALYGPPKVRERTDCIYCGMDHPNGTLCPDVDPPGTRWDQ